MSAQLDNLLDYSVPELIQWCGNLGEKPFRAKQLAKWIHQSGVDNFDAMTDLAKSFRQNLNARACIQAPSIISDNTSKDGTRKWLFDVGHGDAVETVFIPEERRGTLCVSSQAGCAVNCRFCSTGKQGFSRNLSTAEIVAQLWKANVLLREAGDRVYAQERPVTNVVMMGMGEPLLNFDNVVRAMSLMRDDLGFGLANKRVTLSTAGLVPMIDRLGEESDVSLAVSLHAPNDELRTQLVPLNKKYPIAELMAACARYLQRRKKGESITFEYTLMKGVNDTPEIARQLARLMKQFCNQVQYSEAGKVNLIPFNPFPGTRFERSDEATIRAFQKILLDAGVLAMVRRTRGDDIDAACGQLAGEVQDRTQVQSRLTRPVVRPVIPIEPAPPVRP